MVILLLVQALSASLGCFISNCPVSGKKRSGGAGEQTQPYQAVDDDQTQPYQAVDYEQRQPYRAVDDEQTQPYQAVDDERTQPYLTIDDEQTQPYLTVDDEQTQPYPTVDDDLPCPSNPTGLCSYPGVCCVTGREDDRWGR